VAAFEQTEKEVDSRRVKELLESGEAQVVDVREPYEYEAGHIAGVVHIELEHLAFRADEIDKDRPVIFQCRLGRRSAMATEAFRASGYDAYNLTGGIQAWADEGLPLEPEGGLVADHGPSDAMGDGADADEGEGGT
jgi:rhodanese-related sulfurtransferase